MLAEDVPEALVLNEPVYVPAATCTVAPGPTLVEACAMVAQGLVDDPVPLESLPVVETKKSVELPPPPVLDEPPVPVRLMV